jgi:mono/diheme cytochrome c family protein
MFLSKVNAKQFVVALAIPAGILVFSSLQSTKAKFDKRSIGEDIFRNRCTICHGLDGSGQTTLGKKLRIPDLGSQDVQQLADDELLEIITDGKGEMPAFKKKLSRDRIHDVISHLRRLSKPSTAKRTVSFSEFRN